LSILNKLSGASIIIIASDKGFLTSEEALIKKTGGKIILSAY
jgi:ribosomal protein S8